MEALAHELRDATGDGGQKELRSAAKAWAAHCVDTYDGALLRKAFAVSAAITDFLNEVEQPEAERS